MPSLTKVDDRKRAAVAIVSPDKGSTKRARKTETGLSSPKSRENEDEEYTGGFITAASIMGFHRIQILQTVI